MLGDRDIQALEGNFGNIVRHTEQHQNNVQNLVSQFRVLLDSYNRLKSDYEEEKEAREKYKRLARGQERNPFVLVLVDGDGYLFKDSLVKAGSDGGITAANLLSDSIKDLIHDQVGGQGEHCRIMVRIYSNLLGLSKALARSGLVGHEARALSPFTASFTRAQELFDWVDSDNKKEGADFKIREMFRLFADNSQCKHIFFAGCHDTGYLSLLTPYRGKTDRITLLKAASFHPEFEKLGLSIREIPQVFTSHPLGAAPETSHTPTRVICKHYQKGICRYGTECTKLHVMPSQLAKPKEDTPSQLWGPIKPREQEYYARFLPRLNSKSQEYIAVNSAQERIDNYCPMPSPEAWDAYSRRSRRAKVCNNYHLGGECGNLSCEYDHSPVDNACMHVVRYIMKQHCCPSGAKCRSLKCYLGHHCQKDGCKNTKPCKFSRHAHTLDLKVSQWVTPIENEAAASPSVTEVSLDTSSNADPSNSFSYLMKDVVF